MPHGPIPVTLKVKVAENNKGVWHVPVVVICSTPFTGLPSGDVIVREIQKFLTVKDNGVEKVQDKKPARAGKSICSLADLPRLALPESRPRAAAATALGHSFSPFVNP